MADSPQLILWQALFYSLGAVGLFAIGALPLRTCILIRRAKSASRATLQRVLILAAFLAAVVLATPFLLQVAKCLLGYHCSANAAGGWINAAFVGAIYLGFEIVVFTIRWLSARTSVAA